MKKEKLSIEMQIITVGMFHIGANFYEVDKDGYCVIWHYENDPVEELKGKIFFGKDEEVYVIHDIDRIAHKPHHVKLFCVPVLKQTYYHKDVKAQLKHMRDVRRFFLFHKGGLHHFEEKYMMPAEMYQDAANIGYLPYHIWKIVKNDK